MVSVWATCSSYTQLGSNNSSVSTPSARTHTHTHFADRDWPFIRTTVPEPDLGPQTVTNRLAPRLNHMSDGEGLGHKQAPTKYSGLAIQLDVRLKTFDLTLSGSVGFVILQSVCTAGNLVHPRLYLAKRHVKNVKHLL